ncbi:MAG: polysaccharide deacetylase family protein [Alphaproteobacteria bacterium]|nr:polysaccharide deacetylase family protein [Alphaproteobacteria bacterium]
MRFWLKAIVAGLTKARALAAAGVAAAVLGAAAPALAAGSGVIVMYHRFGEDAFPSTSVTVEQFDAHIAELTSGDYTVVPLSRIAAALQNGERLPDRTVAITVDDAFRSLYDVAWPRFRDAGLPFTVFVATAAIDRGAADYMTWDELRELSAAGVEIGSQTVNHPHLPDLSEAEARAELAESFARIQAEIGADPVMLAYPYGEASASVMALARAVGYRVAFGQHSGAPYPDADAFYLPRYPINMNFGGVERFRRVINTLPIAVSDISPSDPYIAPGQLNPPAFGFTLPPDFKGVRDLACYHSAFGKVEEMTLLGEKRVELRFPEPFAAGRNRINCTAPGPTGRWRWFGMQYYTAE